MTDGDVTVCCFWLHTMQSYDCDWKWITALTNNMQWLPPWERLKMTGKYGNWVNLCQLQITTCSSYQHEEVGREVWELSESVSVTNNDMQQLPAWGRGQGSRTDSDYQHEKDGEDGRVVWDLSQRVSDVGDAVGFALLDLLPQSLPLPPVLLCRVAVIGCTMKR